MPMTTLENDVLNAAFATCKMVLQTLQPQLASLQLLYDSAGGVKETLTQEELDANMTLSGLSKTTVDDGLYVLTTVLLPGIVSGAAALTALSARFRGILPPPPLG